MQFSVHTRLSERTAPSRSVQTPQRTPRIPVVARYKQSHEDPGRSRFPLDEGLQLSIFHPYKKLPPEGVTVPLEEEMCDPETETCKTPLHVYEARCVHCYGTGWSRLPSNGRRGHLATCVVCHGLGYVRRTTARFTPDVPDKHQIMARPLLWKGKLQKHWINQREITKSLSGIASLDMMETAPDLARGSSNGTGAGGKGSEAVANSGGNHGSSNGNGAGGNGSEAALGGNHGSSSGNGAGERGAEAATSMSGDTSQQKQQ